MAVFLAMASAAYACTVFKGSITITGNATAAQVPANFPSAGGSSLAWGNGKGMTFCLGTPTGYTFAPVGPTGTVKVDVASHACTENGVTNTYRLPAGTYDVNFLNVGAFTNYSNRNWVQDCMSSTTSGTDPTDPAFGTPGVRATQTRQIGSIVVDNLGSGTTPVPLNLNADMKNATTSPSGSTGLVPSEEAGVCVSTPIAVGGTPLGMQGPITIV